MGLCWVRELVCELVENLYAYVMDGPNRVLIRVNCAQFRFRLGPEFVRKWKLRGSRPGPKWFAPDFVHLGPARDGLTWDPNRVPSDQKYSRGSIQWVHVSCEIRSKTNVTSRHDSLAWTGADLTYYSAMTVTNLEATCTAKPSLKLGLAEKWRVTNRQERLRGLWRHDDVNTQLYSEHSTLNSFAFSTLDSFALSWTWTLNENTLTKSSFKKIVNQHRRRKRTYTHCVRESRVSIQKSDLALSSNPNQLQMTNDPRFTERVI